MNKKYKIKYRESFFNDLNSINLYISNVLDNKSAALKFIDTVEKAIILRSENPTSYEIYESYKNRKYNYYRIYVKNYIVFYVVYDDIMEVRRILYSRRNFERMI